MDNRDYYEGLCRDYYRDPFPHSLLSARELLWEGVSPALGPCGLVQHWLTPGTGRR